MDWLSDIERADIAALVKEMETDGETFAVVKGMGGHDLPIHMTILILEILKQACEVE